MSYIVNFIKCKINGNAKPEAQFDMKDIKLKEIKDIIIHGVVRDCETGEPIPCALVKIFLVDDDSRSCSIDGCHSKEHCPELDSDCAYHTYTDSCGQYLFNIPYEWRGREIVIKAVKTNREDICDCEC